MIIIVELVIVTVIVGFPAMTVFDCMLSRMEER